MTPIQTGHFFNFLQPGGRGHFWSSPLYNFKTANNTATKITQNNVLIISSIQA